MGEKRNMISQLRTRLLDFGATTLTRKEYDQLQAEWIMRTCPPSVIAAVRALESVSDATWASDHDGVWHVEKVVIMLARQALSDPIIQDMLAVPGHGECCDVCSSGGACKSDDYDNEPVEESEEEC